MHRPLFVAVTVAVPALLLIQAVPARAADDRPPCSGPQLAILGRAVKTAHFVPGPRARDGVADGVVIASTCKRLPEDPRLTLVAAAWDAGKADSKALVLALVDEGAAKVVASYRDDIIEDAAVHLEDYSLRLDTAAYDLAPGVRAVGLDIVSEDRSCGEAGYGPQRTLYVRDGTTLRPVLSDLYVQQWAYLRGNQPRCSGPGEEAPLLEDYDVTIGLGAAGPGGWRDLALTAVSKRSDHLAGRKPLHVRVPYDGKIYPLDAFDKAFEQWRK